MNPVTLEQTVEVQEDETVTVVPTKEEFVACAQCGHRSYLHFYFRDGLMSFCGHHGTRNEEKLTSLGASILADYRDTLQGEKRTQGEP